MRPHTSLHINKLLVDLLDSVAHILVSIPDLSNPRLFICSTLLAKENRRHSARLLCRLHPACHLQLEVVCQQEPDQLHV